LTAERKRWITFILNQSLSLCRETTMQVKPEKFLIGKFQIYLRARELFYFKNQIIDGNFEQNNRNAEKTLKRL
jgi:hypothetical protein